MFFDIFSAFVINIKHPALNLTLPESDKKDGFKTCGIADDNTGVCKKTDICNRIALAVMS